VRTRDAAGTRRIVWHPPSILVLVAVLIGCTSEANDVAVGLSDTPGAADETESGEEAAESDQPGEELDETLTHSEIGDLLVACLAEQGFAARREGTGITMPGLPDEQQGAADDAFNACALEIQGPPVTPTRENLARLYDEYLEAAECLRERGVSVPDPPSRGAWVEQMLRPSGDGSGPWEPFMYAGALAGYSSGDHAAHLDNCPQPQLRM
jgi:hypothetical protein